MGRGSWAPLSTPLVCMVVTGYCHYSTTMCRHQSRHCLHSSVPLLPILNPWTHGGAEWGQGPGVPLQCLLSVWPDLRLRSELSKKKSAPTNVSTISCPARKLSPPYRLLCSAVQCVTILLFPFTIFLWSLLCHYTGCFSARLEFLACKMCFSLSTCEHFEHHLYFCTDL